MHAKNPKKYYGYCLISTLYVYLSILRMDKVMFLAQKIKMALLDPVSVQISNRTVGR